MSYKKDITQTHTDFSADQHTSTAVLFCQDQGQRKTNQNFPCHYQNHYDAIHPRSAVVKCGHDSLDRQDQGNNDQDVIPAMMIRFWQ
jgi:hypothetical protein